MKKVSGLVLSECKISIITPHALDGTVQTTQTVSVKLLTALILPLGQQSSLTPSFLSRLYKWPAFSLRTSLFTYPQQLLSKHNFPPSAFPFLPHAVPNNSARFFSFHTLATSVVSRRRGNISRGMCGTSKPVCTQKGEDTHAARTHQHTRGSVPGKQHLCSPLDRDSVDSCSPSTYGSHPPKGKWKRVTF